jgi:hypothetical protein
MRNYEITISIYAKGTATKGTENTSRDRNSGR